MNLVLQSIFKDLIVKLFWFRSVSLGFVSFRFVSFRFVSSNIISLAEGFNSNETCPCSTVTQELNELELRQTVSELDFNRLELNDAHPNSDNDVDNNVNLKCNFKYYSTHEFHKLQRKLKAFKHMPFSLIHTNICSVNKNINSLEILQATLGSDITSTL